MKPLVYLLTFALAGVAIIWCPTVTLSLPLGQDRPSVGNEPAAPGQGATGATPSTGLTQAPMMVLTPSTPLVDADLQLAEVANHGEHTLQPPDPAQFASSHAGPTP